MHPLEPAKGWAIEIKGSGSDTVFVGGSLVVKKLGDLEDPTQGIVPIEVRDVQLNGVTTLWVEWLVGSGDRTRRQPCLPARSASRIKKKWLLLIDQWWCVGWYGPPLETGGRSDQCYEQEGDASLVSRTKASSQ